MDNPLIDDLEDSITRNRMHNMAVRYRFFNRLDPSGTHLVFFIFKNIFFIRLF